MIKFTRDVPWPDDGLDADEIWPLPKRRYHVRPARYGDDIPGATLESIPCVTIFNVHKRRERTIAINSAMNVTPGEWEDTDQWAEAAWEHTTDWWAHTCSVYFNGYKSNAAARERLRRLQIDYAKGTHDWHGNPLPQARGPCDQQTDHRRRQYALAALAGCADELARTIQGSRNDKLNALSYRLGRMAARGWLTEDEIGAALWAACETNGYIDDDGQPAFRRSFQSGFRAGLLRPAADPVDRVKPDPAFAARINLRVSS